MNTTTDRKRIYRVETAGLIVSLHASLAGALNGLNQAERHAADGACGLTPETLLSVTRWNGKRWVAISEVR